MIKTKKGKTKIYEEDLQSFIYDIYQINACARKVMTEKFEMSGYQAYKILTKIASVTGLNTKDAMYSIFEEEDLWTSK